jgi:hypothetical protein
VGSFEKSVRSDDDDIGLCSGIAGESDGESFVELYFKYLVCDIEKFSGSVLLCS